LLTFVSSSIQTGGLNFDAIRRTTERVFKDGWEVVVLSPVWDDTQTFRNASVLVASHGAALMNAVFMPRTAAVVELRPHTVTEYGPTCDNLEFWVERGVQTMKEINKVQNICIS